MLKQKRYKNKVHNSEVIGETDLVKPTKLYSNKDIYI